MEGSESEAIFDSLNLNPQLFINEVLNSVDDLLDGAFDFFLREASSLLRTEGTERANDLCKGVGFVKSIVQEGLDERLAMWETYCLQQCFVVPQGFKLPKGDDLPAENMLELDQELDAELDSLRKKISLVNEESTKLNRELQELELQSSRSNSFAESVNEALQLYEQHSINKNFQEFAKTGSEFQTKLENLKAKSVEEFERLMKENMQISDEDLLRKIHGHSLWNANLEDLQQFNADMRTS